MRSDGPAVGVLSPLVGGFYFGGLLAGVSAAARDAGGVVIAVQTFDAGVEFTEEFRPRPLGGQAAWDHVDGHVVVTAALQAGDLEDLVGRGKPVIAISNPAEGIGCPSVMPDNRSGVRAAVSHLVDHGHRQIAFVGCLAHTDVVERFEAYQEALGMAGLPVDPALTYLVGDANDAGGEQAAAAMIAAGVPSTAVFAATDQNALGLMAALGRAGFSLPEDQAVIGFDDIEAGRWATPSLTTLRADFEEIGRFAGDLLLRQIAGEQVQAGAHYVPTPLILRASCGCAHPAPTAQSREGDRDRLSDRQRETEYFRDAFNTQYEVSMTLLSDPTYDVHDLRWLRHTSVSAGLLALWAPGGQELISVGEYYADGTVTAAAAGFALGAFPPLALVDLACARADEAVFLLPVRSGEHDWGWLCVTSALDYKPYVGRETFNQWAALLTAGLTVASSRRELTDLGRELGVILENSPDAVARYDGDLRYRYVNQAAEAALGTRQSDLVGRTDAEVGRRGEAAEAWTAALEQVVALVAPTEIDYSQTVGTETRWYQARMVPLLGDDDGLLGVVSSSRDISELKRAEQAMTHQALHDALTGLANRVLFADRLTVAIERLSRSPGSLAVLFVDLDHFKEINDNLGHEVGDRMLVEVARRLTACCRRSDSLSRFGGDEFVLLCDQLAEDEDVRIIADRLGRSLAEPYVDGEHELSVTASIGIVLVNDPRSDVSTVIRNADEAMYGAKAAGRDRSYLFDADLRDRAAARHSLESDLRYAVQRNEFHLAYQPMFSLSSGRVLGVEALIRWQHPVRGLVSPEQFIALAEHRGLIVDIGTWVINESFRQLAVWTERDELRSLGLAVNVSSRQLADPAFIAVLSNALERHHLDPGRITLEITETSIIGEGTSILATLARIRALGLLLALDDFGTGYSSLVHLRDFPVNTLKIDRSFVNQLGDGTRARQIIGALIAMAHYLDMTVVAEGIELQSQWDELQALGCDEGQGFLVARPQPASALLHLVQTRLGVPT